jgi:alcohol dehydrogenase (cytochrome c)
VRLLLSRAEGLAGRGSPIQAPPVSYSVSGKQYVAVLVGARMWPFIVENAPELKNQTTASMLYVFGL